ncbi:MAG: putative DNA-binding domain-containing protein [Betaproteobacteria bacterium]|nr:putative DNA-binding domain-containing protein [Betaproteobacteria bacterium]
MTSLAQLQMQFQDYLLTGTPEIAADIVDDSRVGRDTRLGIYKDAYRLRLIEALSSDYAAVRAIAGDELYEAIANDYIHTHPSTYPNIRWYGDTLADFIAHDPRCALQPELVDIARFEWAMTLAFDAPDQPILHLNDLATLPEDAWPDLQLVTQQSLQLLPLHWNAPALWKFARQDTPRPSATRSELPITWAIWRQQLTPYYRSLSTDEAWALSATQQGATFAELCEGLIEWNDPEVVAVRAISLVRQWLADEIITGYR